MKAFRVAAPLAVALIIVGEAACGDHSSSMPRPSPEVTASPNPPRASFQQKAKLVTLPEPTWRRADLTQPLHPGQRLVADVDTGDLWELSLDPQPATPDTSLPPRLRSSPAWPDVLTWSPTGEALVEIHPGLYVGQPGGRFRYLVSLDPGVERAAWSPDGRLIAISGGKPGGPMMTAVIDASSGAVIAECPGAGSLDAWSADSRFLMIHGGSGDAPQLGLWNLSDGSIRWLTASEAGWSHSGHRLVYRPQSVPPSGLRVLDAESGTEERIASIGWQTTSWGFMWSPDDRFVAVGLSSENANDLRIIDTSGSGAGLLIHGVWLRGWLADDSVLFTKNPCIWPEVMTVGADGTGLRVYETGVFPRSFSQGPKVGVSFGDTRSTVRLIVPSTGETRDLVSDLASDWSLALSPPSFPPATVWSPEAKYLLLGVEEAHTTCQEKRDYPMSIEVLPGR